MAGIGHNGPPEPIGAPELVREVDVVGALNRACREAGGQKAWAEANGVTPQHLNDVLNRRREISDRILAALGFARVTRYARVSISAREPGAARVGRAAA